MGKRISDSLVLCGQYWKEVLGVANYDELSALSPRDLAAHFVRWERLLCEQTSYLSDLGLLLDHPIYKGVVAMQEEALPLLFLRVRAAPRIWMPAIETIVVDGPELAKLAGPEDCLDRWVHWGKDKGYSREV